jgi:TatD-related deoxyribonuclease
MQEKGFEAAIRIAHVETPEMVYGIDTETTLAR